VKEASSWLTALPLQEHGLVLHKSAFLDAFALCYGCMPLRTPSLCACRFSFSMDHVLSCPKCGLPSLHHNDIRDLTAKFLTEMCSQVIVEPELLSVGNPDEFSLAISNTQEGARLDVAMNSLWGGQSGRCFVYVRVFSPCAPSDKCSSLAAAYKKHENIKCHAYGQRIREVEHAPFTPHAFTLGWLCCCVSFLLLQSAITCLRGAWSSSGHYDRTSPPMNLARVESHLMDN